jgi:hypothetical protein
MKTTTIGTEKVGARVYVTGETYSIRDRLKSAGCHWDGERRQWWIGAAKAAEIEVLIGRAAVEAPPKEDLDAARVQAKVEYKGRTYYAIAETRDGAKRRLVTLDGKVDFWAQSNDMSSLKTYHSREYRGRTEYTTLGSIRRFVEREQRNRQAGGAVCAECGTSGELVRDLEDGLMKHRQCCDIEP